MPPRCEPAGISLIEKLWHRAALLRCFRSLGISAVLPSNRDCHDALSELRLIFSSIQLYLPSCLRLEADCVHWTPNKLVSVLDAPKIDSNRRRSHLALFLYASSTAKYCSIARSSKLMRVTRYQ